MKIKQQFIDLHKDSKNVVRFASYLHLCVYLHLPAVMHRLVKSAST